MRHLVFLAFLFAGCGAESCEPPAKCENSWQRLRIYEGCTESVGDYSYVCVSPDGKIVPATR